MARMISFLVLVAIILGIGLLTYKVLASFLLPMFLAVLLVVMFRPLHVALIEKCKGRERLAAALTTLAILLIVLLPVLTIVSRGAHEAYAVASGVNQDDLVGAWIKFRDQLGLNPPEPAVSGNLARINEALASLAGAAGSEPVGDEAVLLGDVRRWSNRVASALAAQESQPPGEAAYEISAQADELWLRWEEQLAELEALPPDSPDLPRVAARARGTLRNFETELLGGPIMAWVKLQASPDPDRVGALRGQAQGFLGRLAVGTPQVVGGFLIDFIVGMAVMIVSLFYFLADGPRMLASLMRLLPLEDRYEKELLVHFAKISRAVVMATLLSAFIQAGLAGIGYWFAGFELVFLLTVITLLLALVPFVGAAAVWAPCALWLLLFENNVGGAIGLALYGVLVVSMADNVIKPYVLHGQSNLHPLLALLSVLGGVKALGPIGIFVGPMVVAFLQALLVILHGEIQTMGRGEVMSEPTSPLADLPS